MAHLLKFSGACEHTRTNPLLRWRITEVALLIIAAQAVAEPPQLFHEPNHESPVTAAPDDLLLLAGAGLASDDIVVYRATQGRPADLVVPSHIPTRSTEESGVATIVSAADAPWSLTVKLPAEMRSQATYTLWVHSLRGEWSGPVTINDARPLWITPSQIYSSSPQASLQRELKVVGRNFQPSLGQITKIRLTGPQEITGVVIDDAQSSSSLNNYVARLKLPSRLAQGHYRVSVNRDGRNWVAIKDQSLVVLADPPTLHEFDVGDTNFGACKPDDGLDDTACIVRAITAARSDGGGVVHFGAGTWDLINPSQPGLTPHEGIVVPKGIQLLGAGAGLTKLSRHVAWNARTQTVAFTFKGQNSVSGFTFLDLQTYQPGDLAAPYLQVGEDWQQSTTSDASDTVIGVSDVTITANVFDQTLISIGVGGRPVTRLLITHNVFGAYRSALELTGDQFNTVSKYRLDDSVINFNVFKPGSELDLIHKTGTLATELGAGHRLDFSGNIADGTSTEYLYAPEDAKGWRAAFFWSTTDNVEEVLVSKNRATCTGDKIGDGEAIAFDSNTNTFGFATLPATTVATRNSITVAAKLVTRQHKREVPPDYYVGHWIQLISGPGLGQTRKIVSYDIEGGASGTTLVVSPDWDVIPVPGKTRISIGREYWQLYVLDNEVDNRAPLCKKSNRSRRSGGVIGLWAQTADTVIAGNHQYDSDGIFAQQNYGFVTQDYAPLEHPCADCTMMGFFNFFLEIRDNVIDGEYDWRNDCSRSGIGVGVAAASWGGDGPPPTVSYGVSIAHNSIRRADEQFGGAIAQVNTWFAGPEPHSWPLADNVLIHHNAIIDIDGPRALPICGTSRPRIGIAFPDPEIAWRTVLYANSCKNVTVPVGPGGVDTVKVCPSSAANSCECSVDTPKKIQSDFPSQNKAAPPNSSLPAQN